jgi:basic membrane protein A
VDSNQNYLHPGQVLTSMLKRVDVAVADAMAAGEDLETGVTVLGLAEDGVGYAMDDNNADLVTEDMAGAAEEAKAAIIAGETEVHDYTSDDSCPALTF